MKKKFGVLLVILLLSSIKNVNAASLNDHLPGGKNYLNENNFIAENNSLSSINSFLVKENMFYTLSFPGIDMIGFNISLEIEGDDLYFYGDVTNHPDCNIEEQLSYCTFKTTLGEDHIGIIISSSDIVTFVNYYGFNHIQLEEGITPTSYQKYIPPFADTSNPEFSGSGAYITSYNTFESIENIINNHIAVIDDIEGDVSNSIVIESDTYSGNEQIVGEYSVELRASDLSGNIAYFNLSVLVKDEINPNITGPNSLTYNISNQTDILTIISESYLIEDDYSSTIINILIDNYTINKDVLGTYMVSFEAVDESLNKTTKTFHVILIDNVTPSVLSDLNFDSYLSNPSDLTSILDSLEFSDNYTDMSDAVVNVITNDYAGNEANPGTYIVNVEVNDESGNILNSNIVINVIDDVNPQIGGPLTYQGSYIEELVLSDFLNMLTVSDNSDQLNLNNVYILNDTYSNRSNVIGTFSISFGVSDNNSNQSTHTISIIIIDDVAPVIYIDNYIVTVDMSSTFTKDDAVKLLINSKELDAGSYAVKTIYDGYSGNESLEGTYIYFLEFTDSDGQSYEKEFVVKVVDADKDEINKSLVFRNVIMYSISLGLFGYIIFKNRK